MFTRSLVGFTRTLTGKQCHFPRVVALYSTKIFKSPYRELPLPTRPFHEKTLALIREHALNANNNIAFINGENTAEKITFQQVHDTSYSVATFLQSRGFTKDCSAAVVLANSWHYAPIFLGTSLTGGHISAANPLYTESELTRQFADSKSSIVFTHEDLLPRVLKAAKECPLVKTIIAITKSPSSSLPSGVISWDEVANTKPNFQLKTPEIDVQNDTLLLPYSSGTTGTAKGVILTHRNLGMIMDMFISQEAERTVCKIDPNFNYRSEYTCHYLPYFHAFGFGQLNVHLRTGSTIVLMSKFDPHKYCEIIQNYKIKLLHVVPPILVLLAKSPLVSQFDLSSVKMVLGGAAPIGKDLIDEVKARHKNIEFVQQAYGMTELTLATHFPDLVDPPPPGSVGRLASNLEMKITNAETGGSLDVGESGEVCIRGPTVMRGYLGREDETKKTIVDGWMHTGDIGYVDKDGNLYIVDRLKELIKVKGFQVPPAELEDLLLSHPRIRDAAVIGIADEKAGELPRAYVVRADEKLTEHEVIKFVEEKVSSHKHLAGGVEFISQVPKSASGKILRRVLREKSKKTA